MMKTIVITGATSSIALPMIKRCMEDDMKVYAICRRNSKNLSMLPKGKNVHIIECNLDELHLLEGLIADECNVFFHFGWAFTPSAERNDPEKQNLNVGYTLEAVKVAKRLGCSRFICSGSQAEYGICHGVISPQTPVNPVTAYGVAKYSAYKQSQILCEILGVEHIWGRIFSLYGPYDKKQTMINYEIKGLLEGEKVSFTKSEQIWDYLYSDDAAEAFLLMAQKGKGNCVYCIGSGVGRPLSEFIKTIGNIISPKAELGIGEREYAKNQVMELCADITSLTKDTGFKPKTSFEDGIKKTIEWFEEGKNI